MNNAGLLQSPEPLREEDSNDFSSELVRQEYWSDFYDNELALFKQSGHEGEEWFEADIRSLVKWISTLPNVEPTRNRVLDVGCGNGLFLIRLARRPIVSFPYFSCW